NAYDALGTALRARHKVPEALDAYHKAIAADPRSSSAHNNLGSLLCDVLRDYDQAIRYFRKAIALNPNNANAYCNLSVPLGRQNKWPEAIDACKKAIDADPLYGDALNNLAWILATCPDVKLRDANQAVALARRAVELAPNRPMYPSTLGVAHYRTGDCK